MKCTEEAKIKRDAELGASSTSRIVNIKWYQPELHPLMRQLTQCLDCTGDLSYNHYSQEAFTVGEMIGTIGPGKVEELLNCGGERRLETTHPQLTFPPEHSCINKSTN